jgi:hypothetical protein
MAAIVGSQRGRVGSLLVAIGAFLLVFATVIFVTAVPAALADHIDATGPLQGNCVDFQAGETGTKSPADYPDVDITLVEWVEDEDGREFHEIEFTISGLVEPGQHVDISVKSGGTIVEDGPYGNGTHTFVSGVQQAISHVRLCVFEEEITTTTPPTSTSTSTSTSTTSTSTTSTSTTSTSTTSTSTTSTSTTTTSTVPDTTTTTTVGGPTTTVADTTTTTVVGGPTTTVADTTTTTVGGTTTTVLGPEDPELPNNGPGQLLAIFLGGLGLLFMGSGSLVIASERRLTIR